MARKDKKFKTVQKHVDIPYIQRLEVTIENFKLVQKNSPDTALSKRAKALVDQLSFFHNNWTTMLGVPTYEPKDACHFEPIQIRDTVFQDLMFFDENRVHTDIELGQYRRSLLRSYGTWQKNILSVLRKKHMIGHPQQCEVLQKIYYEVAFINVYWLGHNGIDADGMIQFNETGFFYRYNGHKDKIELCLTLK